MQTFNNTSLFTGYLKQLLHEFNLPSYRVYTKQNQKFFNKYHIEDSSIIETVLLNSDKAINARYVPYIKDGFIQEYINGKWYKKGAVINDRNNLTLNIDKGAHVHFYNEGQSILNYTRNLEIRDGVYDSYTHEYLGEYLRFLRDYNDLNLMPLYNCFSNRAATNINFAFSSKDRTVTFKDNDNYKLFVVPVKLFKEYTIAIDSAQPVEVCCVIWDKVLDKRIVDGKFRNIPVITYEKIRSCQFNQPFLYTRLVEDDIINLTHADSAAELAQSENNLKLLIKLPKNNTSSIVILEGDYRGWNDQVYKKVQEKWIMTTNNMVINKDYISDDIPFELKTPLQLLRFNTQKQHPYADKLESYLLGNVITGLDETSSNIKRVQKVMRMKGYEFSYDGVWTDGIREIVYDYVNNKNLDTQCNTFEINHDILGYIDRDIEKYYKAKNKETKESCSLISVELEEDK